MATLTGAATRGRSRRWPARPLRLAAPALVMVAAPWSWFLVRDSLGVVGDVMAIVLPAIAALIALVACLAGLRWPRAFILALSELLLGLTAVIHPWIPSPTAPLGDRSMTIAGANIGAGELDGAQELLDLHADILVISEIGSPLTNRLAQAYPHSVAGWIGPAVGVFSRYPLTVLEKPNADLPGEKVRVDGPAGPFVLFAVHVPRPWWRVTSDSYETTAPEHYRLMDVLAARVAAESLPVVVVGDMNTTDRGRDYRHLLAGGGLTDAMLTSWGGPTQIGQWKLLLVRIDHILISRRWCADGSRRYLLPASDHLGTITTVGPCADHAAGPPGSAGSP